MSQPGQFAFSVHDFGREDIVSRLLCTPYGVLNAAYGVRTKDFTKVLPDPRVQRTYRYVPTNERSKDYGMHSENQN
jgi:hypothetical protein